MLFSTVHFIKLYSDFFMSESEPPHVAKTHL